MVFTFTNERKSPLKTEATNDSGDDDHDDDTNKVVIAVYIL